MINLIMNIMLTLINSVITAAVVSISLVGLGHQDLNYWIGCILAFISGFGLRLMGDIRNKKIGWLSSFVQFISSVCLCMAALVFKPSFATWMKLEYFVFFSALCSIYIIDVIEKSFQGAFVNYMQLFFKGIVNAVSENTKRNNKEDNS